MSSYNRTLKKSFFYGILKIYILMKKLINIVKFRLFWSNLVDLIYPKYCQICSQSISDTQFESVCVGCLEKISVNSSPLCLKCGQKLENSRLQENGCKSCRNKNYFFDRALSVCEYSGVVKKCIQLFKYKRKLKLGRNLSKIMIKFLKDHVNAQTIDLITAVPLHRTKLKERGFNQAEVLAENIRLNLNLPATFNNLRRLRKTRSQYQLPVEKRRLNLQGAFDCSDKTVFKDKTVLIVDDIFTTGSTLNECSKVIKSAGAKKVYTLTMAR
jgi:ComF family protein